MLAQTRLASSRLAATSRRAVRAQVRHDHHGPPGEPNKPAGENQNIVIGIGVLGAAAVGYYLYNRTPSDKAADKIGQQARKAGDVIGIKADEASAKLDSLTHDAAKKFDKATGNK